MQNINNNTEQSTATVAAIHSSKDEEVKITRPSLPPLYFHQPSSSTATSTFPLCSELETNILSYLNWGDYARLAPVHRRLQHIVHDAAQQSTHAKWTLAQSLLQGHNGLEVNAPLAKSYLLELCPNHALAQVTSSLKDFKPQYEEMKFSQQQDHENDDDNDNNSNQCEYATAAMRQLATYYFEGRGDGDMEMNNDINMDTQQPQDNRNHNLNTGLAWLQQAYHNGDVDAAYETATIFEHGHHNIPVDIYVAARWFLAAAKRGHVESMAEYAMCLELGCGVDQCDAQALDWYTKAAQCGHVTAHYSVGEMFESARGGVPQSDTEAVLWYYRAAMLGDEDSKLALKRLSDIARIVVPGWAAALNVESAGNAQ